MPFSSPRSIQYFWFDWIIARMKPYHQRFNKTANRSTGSFLTLPWFFLIEIFLLRGANRILRLVKIVSTWPSQLYLPYKLIFLIGSLPQFRFRAITKPVSEQRYKVYHCGDSDNSERRGAVMSKKIGPLWLSGRQ